MAENTIWMCRVVDGTIEKVEQVAFDAVEIARRHFDGWRQCGPPGQADDQPETPHPDQPLAEPEPTVEPAKEAQ
jgi:hypothetical protein